MKLRRQTSPKSETTSAQPVRFICTGSISKTGQLQDMVCRPYVECGDDCSDEERETIYVQNGAINGNGSRAKPYGSLLEAQNDSNWTTLVVLYTVTPLDGGILLRNGQRLVGDDTFAQPVISNTTTLNGGNGVLVESGSVLVENIHFDNTQGSAINYDNATNLTVNNVTITLWNQGNQILDNKAFLAGKVASPATVPAAAIHGQVTRPGHTNIFKTTITGFGNVGVFEDFYGSDNQSECGERTVCIEDGDFSGFGVTYTNSGLDASMYSVNAIIIEVDGDLSQGQTTSIYPNITKNKIRDFAADVNNTYEYFGISLKSLGGGYLKANVNHNQFLNISGLATNMTVSSISLTAQTNPPPFPVTTSNLDVDITKNTFDETLGINSATTREGIFYLNNDGNMRLNLKKNVFTNIRTMLAGFPSGIARQKIIVKKNQVDSSGIIDASGFIQTLSAADFVFIPGSTVQSDMIGDFEIERNNYVAGSGGSSGIFTLTNAIGGPAQWNSLSFDLKNNCFDGTAGGFADLFGVNVGVLPVQYTGQAQMKARNNNFVGFTLHVFDTGGNTNYDLRSNYWSPPVLVGGNAVVTPPSTIDVSNALVNPVLCFGAVSKFKADSFLLRKNWRKIKTASKDEIQKVIDDLIKRATDRAGVN